MSEERLDIVIFGASGFTGKHAVKEAKRLAKDTSFTWAIAGRRKDALEAVLREFAPNSKNVKIIIADLKDESSLVRMAEQAKVLVNCCGPYRFYGEPVIKACIAAKTHQVDISAEVEFMERIQLNYDKAAEEAGIYIVSACGFGSIPCEMGIAFAREKFDGEINSVETYLRLVWPMSKIGQAVIHYGTWESLMRHFANEAELRDLHGKLYPNELPEFKPRLKTRNCIHRNPAVPGYSAVLPQPDVPVNQRTQRFMFERYKKRPVQLQNYITFPWLFQTVVVAIFVGMAILMSKCSWGLYLLLKYPRFFTAGLISHNGPSAEMMSKTSISITFVANGWSKKLAEPTDQHDEPPNKQMITKVTGVNPGYGLTNVCLLLSALMIVKQSHRMPGRGGVLPPGAAFAKTSLIEELGKYDVNYEVVSSSTK